MKHITEAVQIVKGEKLPHLKDETRRKIREALERYAAKHPEAAAQLKMLEGR